MQGMAQLRAPASSVLAHRRIATLPREARLVGAGLAALLAIVIVAVLVSGSSGEIPPATGAATVVPAQALAYVHLSTDPGRPAVKRAARLGAGFADYPRLLAAVESRIGAIVSGGAPFDFARDMQPWLGKEAALALLNTTAATAGSLVVLDVSARSRAQAFLTRSGARPLGSYRGVQMLGYPTGTELAFVAHYLIFGQDASVRAGIDVAAGGQPSLADDASYQHVAAGEPADRILDAYASAAGVRRVLDPRPGLVGAAGALVDQPALTGASLSISPASGGARMRVHSVLDPELARVDHAGSVAFTPSLQSVIPAGSMLLLDSAGLGKLAPHLLRAAAVGGVGGQVAPLLARLGSALTAEGVNVNSIVSLFGRETAVAITPAPNPLHAPSLTIVTRTTSEAQTNAQLGALEAPLAQLFAAPSSGPGQSPLFNDRQVAGVTAHQLSLTPGLQLDYAVFRGLVVVSTSLDGIAAVASRTHALASQLSFHSSIGTPQHRLTSLVFLDFSQLLSLGEQTGLSRNARFRALLGDLQRIRVVGMQSNGGETDTTAELFLQIQ
jgi:uncharacterized protein DUF3352